MASVSNAPEDVPAALQRARDAVMKDRRQALAERHHAVLAIASCLGAGSNTISCFVPAKAGTQRFNGTDPTSREFECSTIRV